MTEEKKPTIWDEIRRTGLFAFLLALPVMIWKSSKVGRTLSWIFVSMFIFWFTGKMADVVFSKIVNRVEIKSESAKVLNSIRKLKEDINSVSNYVGDIDGVTKRQSQGRVDQVLSEYREKLKGLDQQIGELEKSIDAFRADERAAVKERIVSLRELVLVGKESVDSKKIRMEFEDLIKNINLLKADEKDRFMKDLKDMGFYVEQVEEQVTVYHNGGFYGASRDFVMPVSVSRHRRDYVTSVDSFYVGSDN